MDNIDSLISINSLNGLLETSKINNNRIIIGTRNIKEFFANHPEKRESQSIGEVYRLLEAKKEQFDPRAFLTPIMDTVMYGIIPDEDVAALMAVVEKGVKEAIGTLIVEFGSYGKAPLVEMASLDEMAERYRKGL